ncbi:RDD family protein [Cumulibacter soli]|uniref:RDD family protein n=1 Tax=Cumulibacter soli TaxID=2546344 RepID=UPI001067DDD3|nr:RDD family protein [Cumulibacter soli]
MAEVEYPGADLGLPRTGMASVATIGSRVGALVIDCLLAGAITWVFTAPEFPRNWSLLSLFLIYTLTTAFFGRTPGMTMVGIGLASEFEGQRLGLVKAAIRTVLLMLLIPGILMDQNRRGLHDKAAGTVVVNAR